MSKRKKKEENMEELEIKAEEEIEFSPAKTRKSTKKAETKKPVSKLKKPNVSAKLESFDQWWMKTQRKHNFSPALKKSLQCHFKAKGFMDSKRFDEGLKDFGY